MIEIRKLEIDFDARILKINGEEFKSSAIVVTLPGPAGWPLSQLYNRELATGIPGECLVLKVTMEGEAI